MKKKLVIFDMDGVLVQAKKLHWEALNDAIIRVTNDSSYTIAWEEHLALYDGLKTQTKLEMLTSKKGLPLKSHKKIWEIKQEITSIKFEQLVPDGDLSDTMRKLRKDGYMIACCSNSIRRSVIVALSKLDIIEHMDLILSNEDVMQSKPHPDIYWKAMSTLKVLPEETLIVEDSPPGLLAATRSGASVFRVNHPVDVTYENVSKKLDEKYSITPNWQGHNMNVLIPMAGGGTRFAQAGYTFPKPLIEVNGKPMIQVVVDNLRVDANFIFIVQKEHRAKYNLDTLLKLITPRCKIVEVDGVTDGAARTTLLAKEMINNDEPLLIANSDQFIEWNSNEFFYKVNEQQPDAAIVTFTATHPKWSFAAVNEDGLVTEVAEKNPISDIATAGVYYWAKGSDYVKYAEQMIDKNIRVNNEFYVCPVFNEAILDNKKIRTYHIDKMWGLGTPEDLLYYLEHYDG